MEGGWEEGRREWRKRGREKLASKANLMHPCLCILVVSYSQDNPQLPRTFSTGVFFFIMMYTGSNILPIAKFLKYSHMKQSFRPDDVSL